MVLFESVEELIKDLVFSLLARDYIRVLVGSVDSADVVNVDDSRLVLVHDGKGFHGDVAAELVHFPHNTSQEFIVGHVTGSINVVDREEAESLLFAEADTEVVDAFNEFLVAESHAVVVISNSERSRETLNTAGSSGSKGLGHFLSDLSISHRRSVVSSLGSSRLLLLLLLLGTSGSSRSVLTEDILLRLSGSGTLTLR